MKYCMILLLSGILMQSFCFLPALGQSEPSTTFDFKMGEKARSTLINLTQSGPGPFQQINLTSWLVSGNGSYLQMVNRYSLASVSNPGPFCYLEVVPRTVLLPNVSFALTSHWTKPCPRTAQPVTSTSLWCEFEFSLDGNLLLRSGGDIGTSNENGTVLWSSNTSGLGVQSVGLLDSDTGGLGNLVLYNINKEIVWGNIRNNPSLEDYSCTDAPQVPAPAPPAGRKLLQH